MTYRFLPSPPHARSRLLLALVVAALAACDAGIPYVVTHLFRLERAGDREHLASDAREVKFLVREADDTLPGPLAGHDCVFQDTAAFPYHLLFLRTLPGLATYDSVAYAVDTQVRATRRFTPGTLIHAPNAVHPSGEGPVLAYTIDVPSAEAPEDVAGIAALDARLGGCIDVPSTDLVWVAVDPAQEAFLVAHRAELAAAGVTTMTRAELTQGSVEVYSEGVSYGYVRIVPPGETATDVGPLDLVVADAAPPDVGVVAGLITLFPQSAGSHLNLRMREKRLPNVRLATARASAELAALDGALVRLETIAPGTVRFRAATLEEATEHWDAQRPDLPDPPSDLTVTALTPLADLTHDDADVYGVKAANLGELQRALEAPYRPEGFAIPFAAYDEHVRTHGIDATIEALLTDPNVALDRTLRAQRLDQLRKRISNAPLVDGFLDRLVAQARATFGAAADTTYLRFRSSTNAEDLEAFSGAGLYDSKTGCIADDLDADEDGPSHCMSETLRVAWEARRAAYAAELAAHPERSWLAAMIADLDEDLTEEKPASEALRKVWRSLYNDRAFDERTYYGIDHRTVFMGVAVVPTMNLERSESVILTNLPHATGTTGLFRVYTQIGEVGVVDPEIPSAAPEELTFLRVGDQATAFTVVRRATLSPEADAFDATTRGLIASSLLAIQDHFASEVYPGRSPLRLDVEMDVDATGIPIFKQVRPYLGLDAP